MMSIPDPFGLLGLLRGSRYGYGLLKAFLELVLIPEILVQAWLGHE